MILKKFLGKTLDAVKKSARQMYGDDFIILESRSDGKTGTGFTGMADRGNNRKKLAARRSGSGIDNVTGRRDRANGGNGADANETANETGNGNQKSSSKPRRTAFKRSGRENAARDSRGRFMKRQPNSASEKHDPSPYLQALRKYAEEENTEGKHPQEENHQDMNNIEERPQEENPERKKKEGTRFSPGRQMEKGNSDTYSRASIRRGTKNSEDRASEEPDTKMARSLNGSATHGSDPAGGSSSSRSGSNGSAFQHPSTRNGSGLLHSLDPLLNGRGADSAESAIRRQQREISALHKRFDKLEALLGSTLITSNFDYVSHPAFQQLVQTGISTSVVARWFSEIIENGVDPYDQPETFMTKLSGIIRTAIDGPSPGDSRKYMLFTGPSGAGKTHLIMKLTLHADFMAGKKVGVVILLPQDENSDHYYTVMEPFCKEWSIPWFKIRSAVDVSGLLEQWENFDHLLIDTPSISTEKEYSFRQYWKLRQLVTPLTPLEVHYVVNASSNRYYFQQSSATHHPLQPDYIAITHLDEISRWGPIIPFLKQMGCAARFVSTGDSIPYSLREFNPVWFARQVLQEKNRKQGDITC